MPDQDDLTKTCTQLTQRQLQAALLEITSDLPKAEVLQKRLPGWMINAPKGVLEALERDAAQIDEARAAVAGRLLPLRSLDEFCSAQLKAYCQKHWQVTIEPQKDLFVRAFYEYQKEVLPLDYVRTIKLEQQTLLHMALQNFTEDETQEAHFPQQSRLQFGSASRGVIPVSVQAFAKGCRDLDVGGLYQQHISDVFNLDAGAPGDDAYLNGVALDIGWMKTLDVKIDAHIACMRGDITRETYDLLCTLLDRKMDPEEARGLLFQGRQVIWQGLNALDCCLWSVLVFSGWPIADYPQEPCVVYMPNEPGRPFFEYPSLNDFKVYLDLKLEVSTYRTFFARYLGEIDRVGFFSRFDQHRTLGVLEARAITTSLAQHFFATYAGKLQIDARTLAVPVVDVDEQVRKQRLQEYLDAGLTLLNLAGFIVPALGLLMTSVAVGQMLGEVYDGIEDWRRGDKEEALGQLVAVAQDITSMVLFAAGAKVVGKVFKRTRQSYAGYFKTLEAVRSRDGQPRLWRPDIGQYSHDHHLIDDVAADAQGLYQVGARSYVKVGDNLHQVTYEPQQGLWRASHRTRQTAYRPVMLHNGEGAWRFSFEDPEEWEDQDYLFSRLEPSSRHPALDSRKLRLVNDIIDKPHRWGYHLAQECLPFAARFRDLYERFRLEQSIRDLVWLLERGGYRNGQSATAQMHALPLLPGWPQGRYFEVLDAQGGVTARYPAAGPFEAAQALRLSEQAVGEGRVFDVLLSGLDTQQKVGLLGEGVSANEEHAALARQLLAQLKADRRPLFEQLYQADGLFEAIIQTLSDTQRSALELPLNPSEGGWRLRRRVAARAQSERVVAGEAFSDKAGEPLEQEVSCRMADSPTSPLPLASPLVRKVRKIYPLFSDVQAAELLRSLGTDALAQAKAVARLQADLERLRTVLKHWKSNVGDLAAQPGMGDVRESRQQVAERIEACWRRQSFVLDDQQVPVPGLTLDGMRVGALPNLPPEIRFDHVRQLSLKNMRLGDDVAYFLKCFKGLRRLNLDRNRLSRLPEYLSRMPELNSLSLPHNQLALTTYTQRKLADMHTLRLLDLSHNPIEAHLDVSNMRDLQTLLLQDARLVDLPVGIARLAHLEQVDLRSNWITVLPDWLFASTRRYSQAINLGGNPLSSTTMTALIRYRDAVGIGMGYVEDDQSRFTELKARRTWLPDEVAAADAGKRAIWANLRDDPESVPLMTLLAQLSGAADSRYVREDMTRRVWEVLQATHDSVELREQVFQLVAHPANCVDGATEIFSQVEVLKAVANATRQAGRGQGNSGVLLTLGRGLFRLSELEKIAATYAAEHASEDPLEVSLAYRVGLAKILQLPGQPKHMRYGSLADLTSENLERAHEQVLIAELSPVFLRFIAQLSFWKAHLKQQFPETFRRAAEPFDSQQQALFENSQNLTDGEYLAQMEGLRAPRRQAINEVMERLTQQMMKYQDLDICHLPED